MLLDVSHFEIEILSGPETVTHSSAQMTMVSVDRNPPQHVPMSHDQESPWGWAQPRKNEDKTKNYTPVAKQKHSHLIDRMCPGSACGSQSHAKRPSGVL